jgi:hypothetical protein
VRCKRYEKKQKQTSLGLMPPGECQVHGHSTSLQRMHNLTILFWRQKISFFDQINFEDSNKITFLWSLLNHIFANEMHLIRTFVNNLNKLRPNWCNFGFGELDIDLALVQFCLRLWNFDISSNIMRCQKLNMIHTTLVMLQRSIFH